MAGICEGRVVIVTGAGRGIGRGHALEFARQGAKVVVNDLGAEPDGEGRSEGPAGEVVDEIRAMGGEAVANGDDVSDFAAAAGLVRSAVDAFGGLDVLVNNAGILRDRMLVSMQEAEWDAVIKVHLKGTFAPMHHAANYWRDRAKKGETNDARVINTSSAAGLFGNVGQTQLLRGQGRHRGDEPRRQRRAGGVRRHGQRHRADRPNAHDRGPVRRHDEGARGGLRRDGGRQCRAARRLARQPRIGRRHRAGVRGGRRQAVGGERWQHGPEINKGDRWEPSEIGPALRDLLAKATPNTPVIGARPPR